MGIKRALISVSDKSGLAELGRALAAHGAEILSTGGTAKALGDAGIPVTQVAAYTGSPEILGGRVKTLHPKVHGGLLARRDLASDQADLAAQGIGVIDLVVVNLYPFAATVARGAPEPEVTEEIDIGGPSMIRSAAKNAAHVAVVVDPADYPSIVAALQAGGELTLGLRQALQAKAFAHTAAYDSAIAAYFAQQRGETFPAHLTLAWDKRADLRYGENPHQHAALYASPGKHLDPSLVDATFLQGKELSYNNLLDLDSALACVKEFDEPCAVIVKHNTPCGVAVRSDLAEAFRRARACDEVSAFGGVVALNRAVDAACGAALADLFLECVVAPSFSEAGRAPLLAKKNLRLLELPGLEGPRAAWQRAAHEVRTIAGGALLQDRDLGELGELKPVTRRQPTDDERRDLEFAWKVCKHVRSNAIVFAKDAQTLAIGGGQTSRVDAVNLAAVKAKASLAGSRVASDAFFPFRDGLDACAKAGASACIQPGGSVRDAEVIAAADEHGMAMVTTGVRHFRH
jgi:phosphoribosylaminoimidazolecarboxamide formyltransferase/IMP cyclohydrolase